MVYKPTNITGGAHPAAKDHPFFIEFLPWLDLLRFHRQLRFPDSFVPGAELGRKGSHFQKVFPEFI
jgi:hypothetical protein